MFDLTDNLVFSVHGGADAGGGIAGGLAGLLSFIESLLSLAPGELFAAILPGIAALDNLHPMFVHFPIALLSLHFLLDVYASIRQRQDLRQVAGWLLNAGAIFAGMTMIAGLLAANSVAHGEEVHQIMENHEHLGISIFLLALALAVWRWLAKQEIAGAANTLYLILAGLLCVLLVFAADLGGLMVYRYGVAVQGVEHGDAWQPHDHAHHDHVH